MNRVEQALEHRWRTGTCSPATLAVARWFLRHGPEDRREVLATAAALLQIQQEAGHVAVNLAAHAGRPLPCADESAAAPEDDILAPDEAGLRHAWGEPWLGDGRQPSVLVFGDGLLQSFRHHRAERRIVEALRRLVPLAGRISVKDSAAAITRLFSDDGGELPHAWQRIAVATVIRNRHAGRRLSLITGGPGTGKTTTVARLLAVLLMHRQMAPGAIAIAAPTGKAADRLAGALRAATAAPAAGQRDALPGCPDDVRRAIPTSATTIHALLGANPASGGLRHHALDPLGHELVIVDEASMVDPVLLEAILAALTQSAHLVLVGDPHQLTSVASGYLLADLCVIAGVPGDYDRQSAEELAPAGVPLPTSAAASALRGLVCALTYNHRAGARRPRVELAEAVLAGDAERASAAVDAPPITAICTGTPRQLAELILAHARSLAAAADAAAALERLRSFQVLSALRRGAWGAQTLSEAVDAELGALARSDGWYHGRAIMITVNDRVRGLMNGDIGICWQSGSGLRVIFPRPAGTLSFATADLPHHDPAWVLTIHKSQGSEYRHVQVILPSDVDHPLVMRELLYTGITRASEQVTIWSPRAVFVRAVLTPSGRRSGLVEAYRAATAPGLRTP
jgi:exodeoxyribonuclease V alpha subunit